jgi:CYTH domain-containing protein/thymidylate kinase
MTAAHVPRIVLTGGPCAGKSTALAHITERLQSCGYEVFCSPEASTLLLGAGALVANASPEQKKVFQRGVFRVSLTLEDSLLAFARGTGRRAVLICDRGVMDGAAYVPADTWAELVAESGQSVQQLRDTRYDAVLHLVTAAEGADRHYGTGTNPTRYEDVHGARLVDRRLREAWTGHPRHRVIDNTVDFAEKMRRVVAAVCAVLDLPEPARRERKFLLRAGHRPDELPAGCQRLDIEQTYLVAEADAETRVRKRTHNGQVVFTHLERRLGAGGERIGVERPISEREHESHLNEADPTRQTIRKTRLVFVEQGHYFKLDRFVSPRPGLELLEVEVDDLARPVPLPAFIEVEREVTGEPAFTNHALALQAG